jgi:hypothetical protein
MDLLRCKRGSQSALQGMETSRMTEQRREIEELSMFGIDR